MDSMYAPIFILAPMDDVTDTVFRRVVSDCAAPDLTMTEFVNVDGLTSIGRPKLLHRLATSLDTAPVIAQIWGKNPENFKQIAREIATGEFGTFAGVDLNFGCPEKSVVKNECCSALAQIGLRGKAAEIIEATQAGIALSGNTMPLSIKTRLGFSSIDYSWHEFLLGYRPSMLTVHVRTTKQMSKVPAQWDAIRPIVGLRDVISPGTKIILNGDIRDRDHGEELAREYGVNGIMIGRGIFQNPFCFARNAEAQWSAIGRDERIALLQRHILLHQSTYPELERKFNPLKKFAKVYISDFPGSSELRDSIMHTKNPEEALAILQQG